MLRRSPHALNQNAYPLAGRFEEINSSRSHSDVRPILIPDGEGSETASTVDSSPFSRDFRRSCRSPDRNGFEQLSPIVHLVRFARLAPCGGI